MIKKTLYIFIGISLLGGLVWLGKPLPQKTILGGQISVPSAPNAGKMLQSLSTGNYATVSLNAGTNVTISTTSSSITISSSGGGGSGGSGNVGTSTVPTRGQLSYWVTSGATPELLGSVGTSSIASGVGITVTNGSTAYVIGAQPSVACNTASLSVFGCLATSDYSILKTATTTFTSPLIYTLASNAVTCQTATTALPGCISAASFSKHDSATTTFSSPLVYTLGTNAVTCPTCTTGGLISLDNFTHPAAGKSATTTEIQITGGLLSTASTTINNGLFLSNLSQGFSYIGSAGLVNSQASSTIKLSWFNNDSGFVTSSGVTAVTATWPIISSGGNTPNITFGGISTTTAIGTGQVLYGTGVNTVGTVATSAPTVTAPITYSGTLGAFVGGVGGAFGCTTAASGVAGCLSNTSFDTFNNKENALTFSFPLSRAVNAISFVGLGTTTNLTNGQVVYATGVNTVSSVATGTVSSSGGITTTAGRSVIGGALAISCDVGTASVPGCIAAADWTIFNNKISTHDEFPNHAVAGMSGTTTALAISTTTNATLYPIAAFSSTLPQLALSAGAGNAQWTFRNAGGNLYISTTTVQGAATTSSAALTISGVSGSYGWAIGSSSPNAIFTSESRAGKANYEVFIGSTTPLLVLDNSGHLFLPKLVVDAAAHTYTVCGEANTFELRFDTTTCVLSAAKFKTKIADLDIGLKELMQVRPVQFYYKPTGDNVYDNNINIKHQQIGVIADEVEKIDSRLVTYDNKGEIKGFNYEQYTAWLTKAIQELAQAKGVVRRNVEENWQDLLIGLLIIGFIYQQFQIRKLKK